MTGIVMFDSAYDDQFPPGAAAYAAYVDGGIGSQPNYAYIVSAFPAAHHLSIALDPSANADCLDIVNGAATPESAAAWYGRQWAGGVARPCFYASASTTQANVVPVIEAAGIARSSARLWTAHYGLGEHICGPQSCGALGIDADGTQWTSSAMGRDLDQSLLMADFFGTPPAPPVPSPVPAWQEQAMKALPLVTEGDKDTQAVRTVQGLLCARGHAVAVDGDFGGLTLRALRDFQAARGLAVDGIAGPATWVALLGV